MKHLIPATLRTFRYYELKLPLYLRNDNCFIEHFKIWYELLMGKGDNISNIAINEFSGISPSSDLLLTLLNIYDDDWLNIALQLKAYDGNTNLLDSIGALFGLRRTFSLEYYETSTSTTKTKSTVMLNDKEFLTLVKAQIIRNYSNGTYEQVMQYYADAKLQILPICNEVYVASVDAYLNEVDITQNIEKLFKAGYLTIEHLGIRYTYNVLALLNILVWTNNDGLGGNATWANDTTGGIFAV
ncbi:MAG: hypothetical protein RSC05_14510 [Acinetobacter sp.]